jgi:hypothetical protein
MEEIEVKVTWRLAWGLFWRWFLIQLGISIVLGIIWFFVLAAIFVPFMGGWGA